MCARYRRIKTKYLRIIQKSRALALVEPSLAAKRPPAVSVSETQSRFSTRVSSFFLLNNASHFLIGLSVCWSSCRLRRFIEEVHATHIRLLNDAHNPKHAFLVLLLLIVRCSALSELLRERAGEDLLVDDRGSLCSHVVEHHKRTATQLSQSMNGAVEARYALFFDSITIALGRLNQYSERFYISSRTLEF